MVVDNVEERLLAALEVERRDDLVKVCRKLPILGILSRFAVLSRWLERSVCAVETCKLEVERVDKIR